MNRDIKNEVKMMINIHRTLKYIGIGACLLLVQTGIFATYYTTATDGFSGMCKSGSNGELECSKATAENGYWVGLSGINNRYGTITLKHNGQQVKCVGGDGWKQNEYTLEALCNGGMN